MSLEKTIETFHRHHGFNKTIWIAYSGGLDSHVLLHLYYRLGQFFTNTVRALYINHGLHPDAIHWSFHCANTCREYGIDFLEKSVEIAVKPGESLEEVAREKRYGAFRDCMKKGDLLLTGHHQDDQAETTLIQLIRGAGIKGLAAMPSFKQLGEGYHARPLLHFSKEILQQYANQHHLRSIHDNSNDNTKWTRNFIRHELLPSLKKRWPTVTKTIARSAGYSAEAQALLEEFVLETIKKMQGIDKNTLSIHKLKQLSAVRQRLVLRTWIDSLGYPLPDSNKIKAIQEEVLTAAVDRMPSVSWKQVVIRRYRDDLYITSALPIHDKYTVSKWCLVDPLFVPGIGQLKAAIVHGKGLQSTIQEVSIRFRQGGEIFNVPGRGRRLLKNLLQEWAVPPWQRDRIPLIFVNEKLIGLVGFSISDEYAAKENEVGYELFLHHTVSVSGHTT